jgi:hypothetical protein
LRFEGDTFSVMDISSFPEGDRFLRRRQIFPVPVEIVSASAQSGGDSRISRVCRRQLRDRILRSHTNSIFSCRIRPFCYGRAAKASRILASSVSATMQNVENYALQGKELRDKLFGSRATDDAGAHVERIPSEL